MSKLMLLLLGASIVLTGCIRAGFSDRHYESTAQDGAPDSVADAPRADVQGSVDLPTVDAVAVDTAVDAAAADSAGATPSITQLKATSTCSPEFRNVELMSTATDPAGGPLSYSWSVNCCGIFKGTGSQVQFDPKIGDTHPCPSTITLEVTSAKTQLTASKKILVTITVRGDVNGDGMVDAADNGIFNAEYGRSDCCDAGKTPCKADLDKDCTVSGSDMLLMQQAFGKTGCKCPP
jgi:hypothetical protein